MSVATNIIKKHFKALLAELQTEGIDTSGIAGGVTVGPGPRRTVHVVVLADGPDKERKRCLRSVTEAFHLHTGDS